MREHWSLVLTLFHFPALRLSLSSDVLSGSDFHFVLVACKYDSIVFLSLAVEATPGLHFRPWGTASSSVLLCMPSSFPSYDFNDLVLFRPLPGPRKRQSTQHSDPKPHSNRPGAVVRAHRPSAQSLHSDRGKAVRSREKKEQSKGREEKVNALSSECGLDLKTRLSG